MTPTVAFLRNRSFFFGKQPVAFPKDQNDRHQDCYDAQDCHALLKVRQPTIKEQTDVIPNHDETKYPIGVDENKKYDATGK